MEKLLTLGRAKVLMDSKAKMRSLVEKDRLLRRRRHKAKVQEVNQASATNLNGHRSSGPLPRTTGFLVKDRRLSRWQRSLLARLARKQ